MCTPYCSYYDCPEMLYWAYGRREDQPTTTRGGSKVDELFIVIFQVGKSLVAKVGDPAFRTGPDEGKVVAVGRTTRALTDALKAYLDARLAGPAGK